MSLSDWAVITLGLGLGLCSVRFEGVEVVYRNNVMHALEMQHGDDD